VSAKRGIFLAPFDDLADPRALVALARRADWARMWTRASARYDTGIAPPTRSHLSKSPPFAADIRIFNSYSVEPDLRNSVWLSCWPVATGEFAPVLIGPLAATKVLPALAPAASEVVPPTVPGPWIVNVAPPPPQVSVKDHGPAVPAGCGSPRRPGR
jgi:hypothetical protein